MSDDKPILPLQDDPHDDPEVRYWRTGQTAWQTNYGASAFGPTTVSDSDWVASQQSTLETPRSTLGRIQALRNRGPRSNSGALAVAMLALVVVAAALVMARWS